MKDIYLYIEENIKKLNFICLATCFIPVLAGMLMWVWLPQELVCWETTNASMSGIGSKFEIVFIFPIAMCIVELILIKLLDGITNKIIGLIGKVMIPIYAIYTSCFSYTIGLNSIVACFVLMVCFIGLIYITYIY